MTGIDFMNNHKMVAVFSKALVSRSNYSLLTFNLVKFIFINTLRMVTLQKKLL